MARSQVATPVHLIGSQVYGQLLQLGFRRSGFHTYRPHCNQCNACVPVRIPVRDFEPSRIQRRIFKSHQHLETNQVSLEFNPDHYALYRTYQSQRHAGGGMDSDSPEQFNQFLLKSGVNTSLIEFRENKVLRAVSVLDQVNDGLSAVYTFYDPNLPKTSFGVYSILWQITACEALGLPYLYLGYWIAQSKKMSYKTNFKPLEGLLDGSWRRLVTQEQ